LLFTAPQSKEEAVKGLAGEFGLPITAIGEIVDALAGVRVLADDGKEYPIKATGHDHFR
jgi:thiamine monophosphate kinase